MSARSVARIVPAVSQTSTSTRMSSLARRVSISISSFGEVRITSDFLTAGPRCPARESRLSGGGKLVGHALDVAELAEELHDLPCKQRRVARRRVELEVRVLRYLVGIAHACEGVDLACERALVQSC